MKDRQVHTLISLVMPLTILIWGCAGRSVPVADVISADVCELPIVVRDNFIDSTFSDSLRYPLADGLIAYYQKGRQPNWVVDYVWFRLAGRPRNELLTMIQIDSLLATGDVDSSAKVQWVTYRVGMQTETYEELKQRAVEGRPSVPPPEVVRAVRRFDDEN